MRTDTNLTAHLLIFLILAACTGCSTHLVWGAFDIETGGFAYAEASILQADEHIASRAVSGYTENHQVPVARR